MDQRLLKDVSLALVIVLAIVTIATVLNVWLMLDVQPEPAPVPPPVQVTTNFELPLYGGCEEWRPDYGPRPQECKP